MINMFVGLGISLLVFVVSYAIAAWLNRGRRRG